jgi:hypothetical protein
MLGDIPPLLQYAFMAWYSVKKKHRDNFTLPFGGVSHSLRANVGR